MIRISTLGLLETYYSSKGILSTKFTCQNRTSCMGGCAEFTGPKSAFVSTGYEANTLPRLLFLSLDSGRGEAKDTERLPLAVRQQNEDEGDTLSLHKHKHWYRTHELAWYILKLYKPDLRVEDAKHFFAHANSAKCCMNKKQKKKADRILFKNCQEYLGEEISILDPKIIVSQGNEAKFGIERFKERSIKSFDHFAEIIELNGKPVFWLHTYHPNNWGAFNRQRNFDKVKDEATGWIHYANLIQSFVIEHHLNPGNSHE